MCSRTDSFLEIFLFSNDALKQGRHKKAAEQEKKMREKLQKTTSDNEKVSGVAEKIN